MVESKGRAGKKFNRNIRNLSSSDKKSYNSIGIILIITILLAGIVLLVYRQVLLPSPSTPTAPPSIQQFYGKVSYANGSLVQTGTQIYAKVNGLIEENGNVLVDSQGRYGYSPLFYIQNANAGQTAEFHINKSVGDIKVAEVSFTPFGLTELNLTYSASGGGAGGGVIACGNGVCNATLGENCSTCPSDCGACPVAPRCGDGTCNNGETCSTCAGDCGACSAPVNNNGRGGGGGGGGAATNYNLSINQNISPNISQSTANVSTEGDNKTLPKASETETPAATGRTTLIIIISLVVILIGGVIIYIKIKNKPFVQRDSEN